MSQIQAPNREKFICLMLAPPYSDPFLGNRLLTLDAMAKQGHSINCFFYLDGVHELNDSQFSVNFQNIAEFYLRIHVEFPAIEFFACSRCVAARGYLDFKRSNIEESIFYAQKMLAFVKVVSIRKLGELMKNGYKLIQI